jgi:hypothetical protein
MANTILLKRSDVANSVPAAGNLVPGELALNFTDGNLFFKDSSNEIVLLTSSQFVDVSGNVSGNFILGNGSQLTGINAFSTISIAGQSNVVADSISDTLTFSAGTGIVLLTDTANDVITIATVGAGATIFAIGGDMGTVEELVTSETDLGLIVDATTEQNDLGTIVISGLIYPDQFVLPSFTVAELADVSTFPAGQMVFVTNESGGSVPAFSDGTNWRRVTDRQIVS